MDDSSFPDISFFRQVNFPIVRFLGLFSFRTAYRYRSRRFRTLVPSGAPSIQDTNFEALASVHSMPLDLSPLFLLSVNSLSVPCLPFQWSIRKWEILSNSIENGKSYGEKYHWSSILGNRCRAIDQGIWAETAKLPLQAPPISRPPLRFRSRTPHSAPAILCVM
jgi:hypothetical protein